MIISLKYNYIFIHVPKTGGNSVTHTLKNNCTGRHDFVSTSLSMTHPQALTVHRMLNSVEEKFSKSFFTFCFVRNPWDRIASYYYFVLRTPRHYRHNEIVRIGSFEKFVFQCKPPISCSSFCFDNNGNCLVDYIGQCETLQKDFDHICSILSMPSHNLPLRNISNRPSSKELYNQKMAEHISKIYDEDIERFGYSFEGTRKSQIPLHKPLRKWKQKQEIPERLHPICYNQFFSHSIRTVINNKSLLTQKRQTCPKNRSIKRIIKKFLQKTIKKLVPMTY